MCYDSPACPTVKKESGKSWIVFFPGWCKIKTSAYKSRGGRVLLNLTVGLLPLSPPPPVEQDPSNKSPMSPPVTALSGKITEVHRGRYVILQSHNNKSWT